MINEIKAKIKELDIKVSELTGGMESVSEDLQVIDKLVDKLSNEYIDNLKLMEKEGIYTLTYDWISSNDQAGN